MDLIPHNLSADMSRSADAASVNFPDEDSPTLIAFRNSQQLSLLVRATAFVFSDPKSLELHELIKRIAPSEATALIIGETGTGKELVARHVHSLSRRSDTNFVAINCGAFSETLIESELFGYERGAFTGAQQGKPGWFETANGGTLFLDEIGDLPLPMQVKILRVLQEREVVRLGGRKPIPIDVRLIAATNVDLAEAVRAGRFREDLFYRLHVVTLPLRPLRERIGDILPLARHFVQMYAQRLHLTRVMLSTEAERTLTTYPWPGNIRELENVIHRALLVCQDGVVRITDLHLPDLNDHPAFGIASFKNDLRSSQNGASSFYGRSDEPRDQYAALRAAWQTILQSDEEISLDEIHNHLIRDAWESNQRNQVRTAKHLNISRNILRTYLKRAAVL
jgi:sigma-54-specific transcriptional regulator